MRSSVSLITITAAGADGVLYTVVLFGALSVVEAIKSADEVTGDAADSVEGTLVLGASAAGALILDDAGEAADGVAVNGMVNGAVTDTALLHMANYLFKCLKILEWIASISI